MLKKLLFTMAAAMLAVFGLQAAVIEEIGRADRGIVIYYGYQLQSPYVFGTDGEKLYVRFPADSMMRAQALGWVPWNLTHPKDSKIEPEATPMTPEQEHWYSARDNTINNVLAVSRQVQKELNLRGMELMARKKDEYLQSPNVDSVRVIDQHTLHVYFKGAPSYFRDKEYTEPSPTVPLAVQLREHVQSGIIPYLDQGHMIMVDHDVEVLVHPCRIGLYLREIEALRSGEKGESIIKSHSLVERFTSPQRPIRNVIEGGK